MRSATFPVPEGQETKGPTRPGFGGFLASLSLSAGRHHFQSPGRSGVSAEAIGITLNTDGSAAGASVITKGAA
eukprot:8064435-Alexandrium_andersonii.AAC.1